LLRCRHTSDEYIHKPTRLSRLRTFVRKYITAIIAACPTPWVPLHPLRQTHDDTVGSVAVPRPFFAAVMDRLDSHVDTAGAEFQKNRDRMAALVAELRERHARVKLGGGEKYLQRHRDQDKLPVRERIEKLLDSGAPLLELSPLAAWDLYDGDAP